MPFLLNTDDHRGPHQTRSRMGGMRCRVVTLPSHVHSYLHIERPARPRPDDSHVADFA